MFAYQLSVLCSAIEKMIKTIWKKELLEQLTSRRFLYCTLIIVSLIWVVGLLRIASYERAQAEKSRIVAETADELRKIDKYSKLSTKVIRTPSPLEVFDRGVTEQKSSVVPIEIYEIPYLADKHTLATTGNPLLAIIGALDVVHVIQIFLALLAILFACESISGEKEDGTLALMLTTNVSRMQVVIGKFLSGVTALNIPIFLGFLGLAIFFIASEHIRLTEADWVGLIGIWTISLFYIAIFYLIGMAISCYTHNTSTSLIYSLFIWTFLVIVLPISVTFFVNQQFHRQADAQQAEAMEDELWSKYEKQANDLVRTAGMGDTYPPLHLISNMHGYWGGSTAGFQIGAIRKDARIADFLDILRAGENLRLQYAQKVWHACSPLWEGRPRSLIRLNAQLQRITPAGAYLEVTGGLAGTDAGVFYDFIHQARQYREQLLQYLRAHDAFGSMKFIGASSTTFEERAAKRTALDLSDLPVFAERREPLSQRLSRIAPGLLSLFIYAGLTWLVVLGLFSRYDLMR